MWEEVVSSLAALLSQPVQEVVGQALSSVWMSVSLWGALSAVTPTPPYWPCPCLSLALPRMPPFNPMNWRQPARRECTPQIAKQFSHGEMGEGKANSHILSTYCVSGWPRVSRFVHVITYSFLTAAACEATLIHSFHRGESGNSAWQGEGSSPGWSDSCLCLLPPPHLPSAHALIVMH